MASSSAVRKTRRVEYPTSDGKPMAETDWHRILMLDLIETLRLYYATATDVYVSGNLLLFYEEGNRRKHISPDVFVVRGVPNQLRDHYLLWQERKAPDVVIELTSKTTRSEDLNRKLKLYRDVLRVKEYVLFDPRGDYLRPRLRGYRLRTGEYQPIRLLHGRLPSQTLGLHFEQVGDALRIHNPVTGTWLPSPAEAERQRAEAERQRAEAERRRAEAERQRADKLLQELDELKGRLGDL